MRKIIVGEFMTLDGVMEGPGPGDDFDLAGWTMPYWDDELGALIAANAAASSGLLLGRVTYKGFEPFFSQMPEGTPEGDMMNNTPKFVVSNTLKSVEWRNSTLISGDVIAEIRKLKEGDGHPFYINGSCTLVHSLLRAGLVDEFQLLVYPVVLGRGKRLFPDDFQLNMKLVDQRTTKTGVLILTYRPQDAE